MTFRAAKLSKPASRCAAFSLWTWLALSGYYFMATMNVCIKHDGAPGAKLESMNYGWDE